MTTTSRAGAAVAATAFVVAGATVVGHKVPDHNWGTRGAVLDIAFAIGLIAVAIALPGLAARLQVNRLGTIGTRVAQLGQLAMAIESIASTIHGGNTLGPIFMLGLLASLVGMALLAIDGFRAGVARALAPIPLLALLVGIAGGDHGGAIMLGIAWAGLAMLTSRDGSRSRSFATV
jgi:hypothetical protein